MSKRVPPLLVRLGLAAVAAAIAAALGLVALALAGVDVERRLWVARDRLLGPRPIGIWQEDETLGWVHRPGARGRHRVPPDFDVFYGIDGEGHRITSGDPSRPRVLFLGGSFTFGHGVEDSEAYPQLLQERWPELKMVNAAVNAWGTAHAVLVLERLLERHEEVRLVVYAYIDVHRARNFLRESWLKGIYRNKGRRNPYFLLRPGGLRYMGLADPERDVIPDDSKDLARQEGLMTRRLLLRLRSLCREREVPLRVVILPDGSSRPTRWLEGVLAPGELVDLRGAVAYERLRYPNDGHLVPEGHRQVAAALEPVLAEILGPPAP